MFFGCHISIKNGYLGAAEEALNIKANTFQYFTKNPRSLSIKDYDPVDTARCKVFCEKYGMVSIAHTPYPTDLTPANEQKQAVIYSLLNDLEIADACGSKGVVVHFGSRKGFTNPLNAYELMIETLNNILSQWDGNSKILLENHAGVPGTMGTTFEELVQVRNLCSYSEKIGFCLDTCHAFASGLWSGENWEEVLLKGKRLGYFDYVKAIHLNNSKYQSGLGKDRHANIFKEGCIQKDQFNDILQTKELRQVPFILETPTKQGVSHKEEIAELISWWNSTSSTDLP
ncbi:deoxyribonuclease IV [Heyndrickxia acidicola]|uniref:Deoxyribonuclease IV n=1 Tax=Heyndrickxia acidicola TaxID=209389 RepID=A0ABU6MCB3_9BACI|nr:deoxyribonuclease IV [Heyndrickxia acidicola]MED1201651.1 deoxyribonuclease IV [Heyndrickxia acidicola]